MSSTQKNFRSPRLRPAPRRLTLRTAASRFAGHAAALCSLWMCSCTAISPLDVTAPNQPAAEVTPTAPSGSAAAAAAEPVGVSTIQLAAYAPASPAPVTIHDPSLVAAQPNSISAAGQTGSTPPDADYTQATPRIAIVRHPEPHPDEYLYDGGDRGYPVHYHSAAIQGLETEDTVAESVDETGRFSVLASNKVRIYSPRFGAVRTVNGLHEDVTVDRLAQASERRRISGLFTPLGTAGHGSNLPPLGILTRSRASGVENNALLEGLDQRTASNVHTRQAEAQHRTRFVQRGEFQRAEEAFLAAGIQAALVWTRDEYPLIQARTQTAQDTQSTFRPQELSVAENETTKGELRIVKLADRKVAAVGDTITFTIRYDNLGDGELNSIRILDNLTPRLQFIAGSETSDRLGTFQADPNGEGSSLIRFELDGPLPGHSGGVITFQVKVR